MFENVKVLCWTFFLQALKLQSLFETHLLSFRRVPLPYHYSSSLRLIISRASTASLYWSRNCGGHIQALRQKEGHSVPSKWMHHGIILRPIVAQCYDSTETNDTKRVSLVCSNDSLRRNCDPKVTGRVHKWRLPRTEDNCGKETSNYSMQFPFNGKPDQKGIIYPPHNGLRGVKLTQYNKYFLVVTCPLIERDTMKSLSLGWVSLWIIIFQAEYERLVGFYFIAPALSLFAAWLRSSSCLEKVSRVNKRGKTVLVVRRSSPA